MSRMLLNNLLMLPQLKALFLKKSHFCQFSWIFLEDFLSCIIKTSTDCLVFRKSSSSLVNWLRLDIHFVKKFTLKKMPLKLSPLKTVGYLVHQVFTWLPNSGLKVWKFFCQYSKKALKDLAKFQLSQS